MYCNIQSAEGQKTKKQGAAKMKNSIIKRTEDYTENRKAYYRLPNSTTMEYLMSHLNHSEGTEDYTENTKTYYCLPNSTTMEYLMSHLNHSEGAVLKKGERVFITDLCLKGFIAGVYEMTETPEETGLGYIECRLNLIAMSEKIFEDSGSAIEWALKQK